MKMYKESRVSNDINLKYGADIYDIAVAFAFYSVLYPDVVS